MSVILAVVGALLFAASAAMQQSAARSAALAAPASTGLLRIFGLLHGLIRNKRWLAGWATNVTGFGFHATALHLGSITVVQAIMVTQLLFALPFAVARRRVRLLRRDWLGTVLVCAGLVALLTQGSPHGTVRRSALPAAVAIAVPSVLLLVVVARLLRRHSQLRATMVAVAAGICFCATAVLVVLATDELPRLTWPLPCILVSTLTGGLLAQEAFSSGSLPTALTAMTITDPAVSFLAGLVLFEGALHPEPIGLVATAVLVGAGVIVLGNSPTLHDESEGSPSLLDDRLELAEDGVLHPPAHDPHDGRQEDADEHPYKRENDLIPVEGQQVGAGAGEIVPVHGRAVGEQGKDR
jgi:hypothetical protein